MILQVSVGGKSEVGGLLESPLIFRERAFGVICSPRPVCLGRKVPSGSKIVIAGTRFRRITDGDRFTLGLQSYGVRHIESIGKFGYRKSCTSECLVEGTV